MPVQRIQIQPDHHRHRPRLLRALRHANGIGSERGPQYVTCGRRRGIRTPFRCGCVAESAKFYADSGIAAQQHRIDHFELLHSRATWTCALQWRIGQRKVLAELNRGRSGAFSFDKVNGITFVPPVFRNRLIQFFVAGKNYCDTNWLKHSQSITL